MVPQGKSQIIATEEMYPTFQVLIAAYVLLKCPFYFKNPRTYIPRSNRLYILGSYCGLPQVNT